MFVPQSDGYSPNTYAIVDGTMKESYSEFGNRSEYSFNAYWIVSKSNTKGALAYGNLKISFLNDYAMDLDGVSDYRHLSLQEVLNYSSEVKLKDVERRGNGYFNHNPKETRGHASVIFGKGNAWTSGVKDEVFKQLVDAWFNLPALPPGTSGWLKFKK